MEPRLQILICTTAGRFASINPAGLPQLRGIEYLISCQNPDGIPVSDPTIGRDDIRTVFSHSKGLSNNRNAAFDAASAPYLLIADDDLGFDAAGLREIIRRFDSDPGLAILTVRSVQAEKKVYPPDGHDISKPFRFYEPVSFEIALRREAVLKHNLRFSPLAGIGAPYLVAGEENLFIHHALKAGLKGRFADIPVASHQGKTTGFRLAGTTELLRTKAAVCRITLGPVATLLRIPLMAWREPAPFFRALSALVRGYAYAVIHQKEL